MVVRIVSPLAVGQRVPAAPLSRAKGVVDALHDHRNAGPHYRDYGAQAPLANDDEAAVQGLAVEVAPGDAASVEYRIGSALVVTGEVVLALDLGCSAPNDVEPSETALSTFAAAIVDAWPASFKFDGFPRALVVRHRPHVPGRDEDNTWANWIAGIRGHSKWSKPLWTTPSPLASWAPIAMASVNEPELPCATRLELIA